MSLLAAVVFVQEIKVILNIEMEENSCFGVF